MLFKTFAENLQRLGLVNGCLYMVGRALQRVSRDRVSIVRYYLVAQPVSKEPIAGLRSSSSNSVREVFDSDAVIKEFPRPGSIIAERFNAGYRCYVSEVRGHFAGYIWLAFGGYDEDEVRCRYEFSRPEVCAWDFDVYVKPEFRMGRTFLRLWQTANHDLSSKGVSWSCSRISPFNADSMAAHKRMGLRKLFAATFFCLGPLQVSIVGIRPFLHISFSSASRPTLKLDVPDC